MIRLSKIEFETIDSRSRLPNSAPKRMFAKKTDLLIPSLWIEGAKVDMNLRKVDTHSIPLVNDRNLFLGSVTVILGIALTLGTIIGLNFSHLVKHGALLLLVVAREERFEQPLCHPRIEARTRHAAVTTKFYAVTEQ